MRRRADQRGSLLVLSLLLVLLVYLVIVAVTTRAMLSAQAVARAERRAHAFDAAESALARAVEDVARGEDPDGVEGATRQARWSLESERRGGAGGSEERWDVTATGSCRGVDERLRLVLATRELEGGRLAVRLASFRRLPPAAR